MKRKHGVVGLTRTLALEVLTREGQSLTRERYGRNRTRRGNEASISDDERGRRRKRGREAAPMLIGQPCFWFCLFFEI